MLIVKAYRKPPTATPDLTPSEKRMMRYFIDAAEKMRRQVVSDHGKLLDALEHEPLDNVMRLIDMTPYYDAQRSIEEELLGELLDAGSRTTLPTINKAVVSFAFDRARQAASTWAKKRAGALISEVTQKQRKSIRDYISSTLAADMPRSQVSRNIRNIVGLTVEQAQWVDNRYVQVLTRALNDGMSEARAAAKAEKAAEAYQKRVLSYRAETIARTEILTASHEGRRQAWEQGIEEGFISPSSLQEWSTNEDGRECELCLEMNGVQVPIGQEFPAGEPPLHPNCRCDVLLITDTTAIDRYEAMSDEELDALTNELINL